MGDGMLHDILAIERQIASKLEQERDRARAWLAEQKQEIDRQAEQALQAASRVACQAGETRCQGARRRGAERLCAMRRTVRQLKALPDESLRQALQGHLKQLTARGDDDHPDGEN